MLFNRRRSSAGLCAMLLAVLTIEPGCALDTRQPANRGLALPALATGDAEQNLEDAGKGDVFALERAIPRIADAELAAVARARSAAARLRDAEVDPLLGGLTHDPSASAKHRALAWSVVADAAFAQGDYARAAQAAERRAQALQQSGAPQDRVADARQMQDIAQVLSSAPRQSVAALAPAPASVSRDKVGLPRAQVKINGRMQEAVLDTGANLSVVSLTTAKRLALRILEADSTVASSSREAVLTRIGIANALEFGGLTLKDVAFLVMDDKHLEFPVPGGYRIDAIVGFPVFRQFKRFRFDRAQGFVPEPDLAGSAAGSAGNLRVVGSSLYVDAAIDRTPVALHLDSGGSASSLSALFAERHPGFAQGLPRSEQRVGGAGGVTVRSAVELPEMRLTLAGKDIAVSGLSLELDDATGAESTNFGVLGGDVLSRFSSWTVDFVKMSFELGTELEPEAHAE